MCVIERDFPSDSYLYKSSKEASYSDSYMIYTERERLSIYEIYEALARATPGWVNSLMTLRDGITSFFRLKSVGSLGVSVRDGLHRPMPNVGEKLDAFTLYFFDENEIVIGEDDRHLNFRLSIQKRITNGRVNVVLSMVVFVNNALGSSYLFCVLPFHKVIMRRFLSNAKQLGYL